MMLPEHVKYLREWHEDDQYMKRPELDEWALQELSEQLQIALMNQFEVELKIWEATQIYKATGIIAKLDKQKGALYMEDGRKFPFQWIIGITRYE